MKSRKRIVLIACSGKKIETNGNPIAAEKLYIGPLFKKSLEYAKLINADKIFILSAKHHLVELDDKLEKYDCYLKTFKDKDKEKWGDEVIKQLKTKVDLENDEFIILAGRDYYRFLKGITNNNKKLPLEGMKIGLKLQELNRLINDFQLITPDKSNK
ncbi:MAG: hypothetical protein MJ002_01830 [Paludibacteraceae bacterium]|nr:hypothetical protein [Paludibacteraceae bacterium]